MPETIPLIKYHIVLLRLALRRGNQITTGSAEKGQVVGEQNQAVWRRQKHLLIRTHRDDRTHVSIPYMVTSGPSINAANYKVLRNEVNVPPV